MRIPYQYHPQTPSEKVQDSSFSSKKLPFDLLNPLSFSFENTGNRRNKLTRQKLVQSQKWTSPPETPLGRSIWIYHGKWTDDQMFPKSFGAMFFLFNEFSLKVSYIDKNTCFVVKPKMENAWLFWGITGIRFAKNMISHLQPKIFRQLLESVCLTELAGGTGRWNRWPKYTSMIGKSILFLLEKMVPFQWQRVKNFTDVDILYKYILDLPPPSSSSHHQARMTWHL